MISEAEEYDITAIKVEAMFYLGMYYLKIKNFKSALSTLSEAKKLNCNSQIFSTILQNLGQIHQKMGEMEPAETNYLELMELETKKYS